MTRTDSGILHVLVVLAIIASAVLVIAPAMGFGGTLSDEELRCIDTAGRTSYWVC